MKVLIVYPKFYVYGGGELLVVRLCNYLSSRGIENSILTTSMLPEISENLTDTSIMIKEPITRGKGLFSKIFNRYTKNFFAGYMFNIKYVINSEIQALREGLMENEKNYDVINIHNFPADIACSDCNKPVVWMCNEPELYLQTKKKGLLNKLNPDTFYFKKLLKFEQRHMSKWIRYAVVSDDYNSKRFEKIYNFKPVVINYGIDFLFFSKMGKKLSRFKKIFYNRFVMIHVGMQTPLKNQLESLKCLNVLKKTIPEIFLVFAGDSFDTVYRSECDDYIRKNSLNEYVLFTGHINRDDLRDLYHSVDLMIHPVRAQGGWLSPFEMLSAGKPVIVSKEMTASEIIMTENIGVVTKDYVSAVKKIHSNPEKYLEMAGRGCVFVSGNLTWDKFSSRLLNTLSDAVKNDHRI